MNMAFKPLSWFLMTSAAGMAFAGFAAAQDSAPAPSSSTPPAAAAEPAPPPRSGTAKNPAKSTAQADAGEPRANTSAPPGTAVGAPAPGKPDASAAPAGTPATGRIPKPAGQKAPAGVDRLDLNTATVTGDREQPKVMYIVPWKSSDIGDLSGKPMNSLLDEALTPVDRDEFRREVAYYDVVKADRSQNGTSTPAAKQGEK